MRCLKVAFAVSICLAIGCMPPPASTSDQQEAPEPSSTEAPESEQPAETERVVAEAGVGEKGRSLDEHEGLVVTPVKSYFSVQEKLVFEVQLKQAMDLYEATQGAPPKSHEEFMSQIVKANNINLPKLPEGHAYVYDPQRGELMVERPKQ